MVVVINGFPMSGKSLFAELCLKQLGERGINISTVDFVKEIAKQCGWDGSKTLKNRQFLSELKDLLTRWNDVPYNKIEEQIFDFYDMYIWTYEPDQLVAFVHCREPQEIQKFVDRLRGTKTLLIKRDSVANNEQSNHADSEVLNYNYDYVIENNGTIEELGEKAKQFLMEIGIRI